MLTSIQRTIRVNFLLAITLCLPLTGCKTNSDGGPDGKGDGSSKVRVTGGGATFVQPIMQEWALTYRKQTKDAVQIDYQGGGSGKGVDGLINQTLKFCCSDAPLNKEQLQKAQSAAGDVVHVPLVIGAVVVPYNLPEVKETLLFSGEILADIYLGKITNWNDAKIKSLNPSVSLPDRKIIPVFRADTSGTSAIFSEYLCKVSEEFKSKVGTSTKPQWPEGLGVGKDKSDGVAAHVTNSPGAIGYVELFFALKNKIPYANLRNAAGKDVTANPESITAAADASLGLQQTMEPYSLHALTFSITNAPGEKSYPISGLSYGILWKKMEGSTGKAIVEFFQWATKDGQQLATKLDYAPLPDSLIKQVQEALSKIEVK